MNYEKKRKRQNGRQEGTISERQSEYIKGYHDGQAALISRLIKARVLPPVTFEKVPQDT